MILDWQGSGKIGREEERRMREAGVDLVKYHPLGWYDRAGSTTARTASCSSWTARLGFIGGWGIADEWLGDAESPAHWRDTHYRIEGPVVAQLQARFH